MKASSPIRVMIVDDHSMVRRGLATILKVRPDLDLVAEASDGHEALQLCQEFRPDVQERDVLHVFEQAGEVGVEFDDLFAVRVVELASSRKDAENQNLHFGVEV